MYRYVESACQQIVIDILIVEVAREIITIIAIIAICYHYYSIITNSCLLDTPLLFTDFNNKYMRQVNK